MWENCYKEYFMDFCNVKNLFNLLKRIVKYFIRLLIFKFEREKEKCCC